MKNLFFLLALMAGSFSIGFLLANHLLCKKYDEQLETIMAQGDTDGDEIEGVKEPEAEPTVGQATNEYVKMVEEITNAKEPVMVHTDIKNTKDGQIFVESPGEFSMNSDDEEYTTVTLKYYADGYLVDEADHVLSEDEIEERVGVDFAHHFGVYEADSVYILNKRLMMNYEILAQETNWQDVLRDQPFRRER